MALPPPGRIRPTKKRAQEGRNPGKLARPRFVLRPRPCPPLPFSLPNRGGLWGGGGQGGKGGRSSRAAIRTPRPRTRQPSNTTIVPNRQATISTGSPSQTLKNRHDGSPGDALPIPASCHKDAAVPPRPIDTALQIGSQQQRANFELRLKPEQSKIGKMA